MRATLEQFFTPLSVAESLVDLLGIGPRDAVIDPACGDGVFLRLAAERGARVVGIDLDPQMAARAQEAVGERGQIFVHDGLYSDAVIEGEDSIPVADDAWDVVVGNPPFKSHGDAETRSEVLRRFQLGCYAPMVEREGWMSLFESDEGQQSIFDLTEEPLPLTSQAPEVLFIERFIQLTRPGGRIGIVLPDGVVSKAAWQPARDLLFERCELYAVIGLPRETFLDVGTEAKTVVLFARKKPAPPPRGGLVCLAEAQHVGVRTATNDLRAILAAYRERETTMQPLVTWKRPDEIRERMTPSYYDPQYSRIRDQLAESGLRIVPLGDLAAHTTYGQVGSRTYDPTGTVQLISTRNHEPTGVDFWEERRFVAAGSWNDPDRSRLQVRDILLTNSGVRAIGRPTLVTNLPGPVNITQHMQLVRPDAAGVCAEAIVIFLQTRFGQEQIAQKVTGVAAAGLTYDDIKSLLVPDFRGPEADRIRQRYRAMDRAHQRAQAARRQIAEGNSSPATQRRFERAIEQAEELRVALVHDMECTIATGTFSF